MTKNATKASIYAYGFDAAGVETPADTVEQQNYSIRFLGYSSDMTLDGADGVILPSGIFEKFDSSRDVMGYISTWVTTDKDAMALREKQLLQNYKAGKWVCFLLRGVDNGIGNQWQASDLAKKILNTFFESVKMHDPDPHVRCKADEFADYFRYYGISHTTFSNPGKEHSPKILAGERHAIAAAEFLGQFFFLPLPSIPRDRNEVVRLVSICTEAVMEYKKRHDLYLPSWVEAVRFKSELLITDQIRAIEQEMIQLQENLSNWQHYKGILSSSGRLLNELVVHVLRTFYDLDLKSSEEYIDDAVIYDSKKNPQYIVEIKGVNGGLKREHVNQVDSHRERLKLGADVPGLLVLNDFMDVEGLEGRRKKEFEALHLKHALSLNIKILRTTTLIGLMMRDEEDPGRKEQFLKACLAASPLVALSSPTNDTA